MLRFSRAPDGGLDDAYKKMSRAQKSAFRVAWCSNLLDIRKKKLQISTQRILAALHVSHAAMMCNPGAC